MNQLRTDPEREEWLQDIHEQAGEWVLCDDITKASRDLPPLEAAAAWQAVHELRMGSVYLAVANALEAQLTAKTEQIGRLQREVRAGEIARRVLATHGLAVEKHPDTDYTFERDHRNMPEAQIRINLKNRRDAYSPNPGYLSLRNAIVDHTGCGVQLAGLAASKLVDYDNLRPQYFDTTEDPEGGVVVTFKGTRDQLPTASDLFAFERNIGEKTTKVILDLFWSLGLERALNEATSTD